MYNCMRQFSPRHSEPLKATWQMSGAITCGHWTIQPSQLSTSYSGNNGWIALYNGQHWEEWEKSSGDLLSPFSYHTCTHIHIQLPCRPSWPDQACWEASFMRGRRCWGVDMCTFLCVSSDLLAYQQRIYFVSTAKKEKAARVSLSYVWKPYNISAITVSLPVLRKCVEKAQSAVSVCETDRQRQRG